MSSSLCEPSVKSTLKYLHPSFVNKDIFTLGSDYIRILSGFANGLAAVCDILIAAGLCWYLQTGRTGYKRTDNIVDRLIIYAINRGVLTTYAQCHAYACPYTKDGGLIGIHSQGVPDGAHDHRSRVPRALLLRPVRLVPRQVLLQHRPCNVST